MKKSIIQESKLEKARKSIRESKDKTIIFSSENDDLNRKILEKEKIDILLINLAQRKDYQKQRDSGFNQVLAKIAKKNKITIRINFNEIVNSKNKSKILSKEKQSN